MRQASTTGGALGNVSNQEIKLLQDSLRSLSQTQDPEQMAKQINFVIRQYQRIKVVMDMEDNNELEGMTGVKQAKYIDDRMEVMYGGKTPVDPEVVKELDTKYGTGVPQ